MHKTRTTAAAYHQEISKKVATIGLLLLTNWLKQQWVTLLQCSGRYFLGNPADGVPRVCLEKVGLAFYLQIFVIREQFHYSLFANKR